MQEEEQHIDIREKLLNLPKVKASDDFINALQRKINLADAELNQKKISEGLKESVWVKLLGKKRNPWLIPSLSLTIVAIFVISIYLFNYEKKTDLQSIFTTERKISPQEKTEDDKKGEIKSGDNLPGKEIANDITLESKKYETRSPSVDTKGFTEQPVYMEPVKPSMEKKVDEIMKSDRSDPVKNESGKIDYKKEDRIYQDFEKKVSEETVSPKEVKNEGNEVNQKIKEDDKKDGKGNNENKSGIIEKKEKGALKKSVRSVTDSTKIDKKALEKIKEEIQKEK